MKDFYYILGLAPNSSLDDIKGAYRKLSKKLHPDLNQGDEYFENKFRDVKEAFETLRDPAKRRLYNEELSKFKSDRRADEPEREQSSGGYYNQATYGAYSPRSAAKPGKIRKKGPGVGLSITLIVLTIIIGIYLFSWFTASSRKKQLVYIDTAAAPPIVHKKHRHKHTAQNIAAAKTVKRTFDTAKVVAVKPVIMNPETVNPAPSAQTESMRALNRKSQPDSSNNHHDYLYTTYVHPNVTGIVQLRAHDSFNSGIIASIPANSRVFVLERGSTYYRVFYNNNIGFVPKWSLKQK